MHRARLGMRKRLLIQRAKHVRVSSEETPTIIFRVPYSSIGKRERWDRAHLKIYV